MTALDFVLNQKLCNNNRKSGMTAKQYKEKTLKTTRNGNRAPKQQHLEQVFALEDICK